MPDLTPERERAIRQQDTVSRLLADGYPIRAFRFDQIQAIAQDRNDLLAAYDALKAENERLRQPYRISTGWSDEEETVA